MADISILSPNTYECIMPTHVKALARAHQLTGVVSGNDVTPVSGMTLKVDAGKIRVLGTPLTLADATKTLDAADATYPRVDILYRAAADGAVRVAKGTPAEVVDPNNLSSWKSYTSPSPNNAIPDGVILSAVFVGAGVTEITANDIWDVPGKVPDVLTSVGDPGDDILSPTEKAVRTALNGKIDTSDIVTEVGDPGSDAKVPSEQAVREIIEAVSAETVTGGDAHAHKNGDGAPIAHSDLSGLDGDAHPDLLNNARGDARYAPIAKGVTGGDSHIHDTRYPLKSILTAAGDIIYASAASTWAKLAKSTDGCRLALVSGLPAWITGKFGLSFLFGDGSAVLTAQAKWARVPIASKITKAYIRSGDTDGVLKSGSITIAIYIHDYNGAIGSASDSFALSSVSSLEETGLNISVAAGKYITAIISGITTCEQVSLDLELEAT